MMGEELGSPIDSVMRQLVETAARRALDELTARLRVFPEEVASINDQVTLVRGLLDSLQKPEEALEAEAALVAWIAERSVARGV